MTDTSRASYRAIAISTFITTALNILVAPTVAMQTTILNMHGTHPFWLPIIVTSVLICGVLNLCLIYTLRRIIKAIWYMD